MSVPKKPTQPTPSAPLPKKSKRGLKGFFRETMHELSRVHWPARHDVNRLTGVVLAVCLITVLFLYLLAMAFNSLFVALFRGGG